MKADREAAERVTALLALPMPESGDMLGSEGEFDPWELFPCLYGSYSSDFDVLAVEVLCNIRDMTWKRDDLASEMFKEMLCTANLCTYGTSPRTCFPSTEFKKVLPALIDKWRAYAEIAWGEPIAELSATPDEN
jgi:hypothetical protein